ncbi:HAD-IC family P-type ATPase [Antarcticibacterium arcticum]|uniref:HAD-IC family P-type ATPase n=1 Tax=Antarcticibacterium arcticum TaxID=2585771 RepID=A0A5B8YIX2_9FLAO|nr:HAD-IC family P-type ATPase [Antarcticibacterium arcticum]QED37008.1 HAD-IC family P-type ATPase [Antarcticibacterium arcticum]
MIAFPHALSTEELIYQLQSDSAEGLNKTEVDERLGQYGLNSLSRKKPKGILRMFFEQFIDPIIFLLTAAMILAFVFGEWIEGYAVLAVILLTVLIGFFMEWQARKSVDALQKMALTKARVYRNGTLEIIQAQFLVPGDIIKLETGDVVPADARLIEAQSLGVKESILTGESNQINKSAEMLPKETSLTEQFNMVFNGTFVSRGNARAIVVTTGDKTSIGQISTLTQTAHKGRTPLEHKLNKLSHLLIWFTLALALLIIIAGYLQGKDLSLMIKTGIALAVAAIPEGLPVVATISLARGMLRLARQKVIIKKLESVQTLGETGIVCTDKTGTLTENTMAVQKVMLPERVVNFETKLEFSKDELFSQITAVAVLCNNVKNGEENAGGDTMEIALLDMARNTGYNIEEIRTNAPRIVEIPFDTELKRMATLHSINGKYLVCVKGAIESILDLCDTVLTDTGVHNLTDKSRWLSLVDQHAAVGLRLLAFANRELEERPTGEFLNNLTLLGVMAFLDPPREDVKEAIKTYRAAGIKVVMITGDHPATAKKIGEEIGLLDPENSEGLVIHSGSLPDFEKLTTVDESRLLNAVVFARMIPKQKLDLITFYQEQNIVVGMLGDGVNDAPALKKADIGIAMGIRGTEAAKEVADVILMDDKFTSTELAIRQGRNIFENVRQFVVFLMSCNLAEIIAVAAASFSSLPMPLLPLQILFLNMVTDIFPALALGMGKGNKDIMSQPPRDPDEPLMTKLLWKSTVIYSISITVAVIGITLYAYSYKNYSAAVANNMAFYTLILGQLFNVFNLPKRNTSFLKNEVTGNPYIWYAILISLLLVVFAYFIPVVNNVLNLVPLAFDEFAAIAVFSLLSLFLSQLAKRTGLTI